VPSAIAAAKAHQAGKPAARVEPGGGGARAGMLITGVGRRLAARGSAAHIEGPATVADIL
jgi:hypothetical protein